MTKTVKEIAAFGRFWKFGQREARTGKLLGVRKGSESPIDMANQSGVYILYERERVVYVGKTERNGLIGRLREHKKGKKWERWDRFSWYGFRAADVETGGLVDVGLGVEGSRSVDVVESVLIEVLNPYLNDQSGNCTGDMYVQVRTKTKKA